MIDKVKNAYKIFLLYFNTIKYLKISQIFFQIKYRLFKTRKEINFDNSLKLKTPKKKLIGTIKKDQSMIAQNEFKFLNKSYVLTSEKDWDSFKKGPRLGRKLFYQKSSANNGRKYPTGESLRIQFP